MKKALKWGGGALAALLIFGVGMSTQLPDATTTTTVQAIAATTEATTTTKPTTTTTVNSADWSVQEYTVDVMDTATKMGDLMDTAVEVSELAADGVISLDQYAELMETARDTTDTHHNWFEGKTPPAGFEESHRLLVKALGTYVNSFDLAAQAARSGNPDLLERATEVMLEGNDYINQATTALP